MGAWCKSAFRPPPSAPDRCFLVNVESRATSPSIPEVAFKLRPPKVKPVARSVKWEPSSKVTPETGFLDLSREIRDMIYLEVCGELKRDGLKWRDTAPPKTNSAEESSSQFEAVEGEVVQRDGDGKITKPAAEPAVFQHCAIMCTSRQIHAEFAEVLYSSPLQLFGVHAGVNVIPLSPVYAGLVRSILVVRTSLINCESHRDWLEELQIATGLAKIFPDATTIRLGWLLTEYTNDPVRLIRADPTAWDPVVQSIRRTIRLVKNLANMPLKIPHSLGVVQLRGIKSTRRVLGFQYSEVESLETPVTEAVKKSRSKAKRTKAKQPGAASA